MLALDKLWPNFMSLLDFITKIYMIIALNIEDGYSTSFLEEATKLRFSVSTLQNQVISAFELSRKI